MPGIPARVAPRRHRRAWPRCGRTRSRLGSANSRVQVDQLGADPRLDPPTGALKAMPGWLATRPPATTLIDPTSGAGTRHEASVAVGYHSGTQLRSQDCW